MNVRTALAGAAAAAAVVAAGVVTAGPAAAADTGAQATYTVWATDVNVRENPNDRATCDNNPSPANCPVIAGKLQPNEPFEAVCQNQGQVVGGNEWWVLAERGGLLGWIAGHYVDHPADKLPDVPECGM
ncbi:SH3 domain-containing protein [Streptomyces montanus]|uniref:SH3 domain-containing protein n=1 Tax=Streptomyces montanus TaxID=2580423 RepID=A0A5R9FZR0_9ACTN|nr:SH3 domain-containing protein [Streptomyces montanus]TLS46223.1 SH3 domain-containing protein [Streptomyces montanus]